MAKEERTAIEKIQGGLGGKLAKIFFLNYITPSIATKIIYKDAWKMRKEKNKQGFVMPIIRDYIIEWKRQGFIETSNIEVWIRKKNRKPYPIKTGGYRLNLEPLYLYCEAKRIKFSEEEKFIINKRVGLEVMRSQLLKQYPNDDLINAILKFYLKQFGIPPLEVLNKEHLRAFKKIEKIADKSPYLTEEQSIDIKTEREINSSVQKELFKLYNRKNSPLQDSSTLKNFAKLQKLMLYIISYKQSPELVSSINRKFMKALGILL